MAWLWQACPPVLVRIAADADSLPTSSELSAEGAAMRHCVAGYATCCAEQKSSIWSMVCHSPRGHQQVLTIEVNPTTRAIVQARGRGNKRPSRQARRVMEDWAEKEGLKVGEGV